MRRRIRSMLSAIALLPLCAAAGILAQAPAQEPTTSADSNASVPVTTAPSQAGMAIATDADIASDDETGGGEMPAELFLRGETPGHAKPISSADLGTGPLLEPPSQANSAATADLEANPASPTGQELIDGDVPIEAATFNGIQPGESTLDDVRKVFGEAYEISEVSGVSQQAFRVEPFQRVEVGIVGGRVASIMIQLDKPYHRNALAKQLQLDDVRPAPIHDEGGDVLGYCYPERGVLFGTTASGNDISHILLEPISAMPFLLRAERDLDDYPQRCLRDVERAFSLDSRIARAHWLQAVVLLSAGRPAEATESCRQAIDLDPKEVRYLLTRAAALAASGQHAEATEAAKEITDRPDVPAEFLARAVNQLGELAATGPSPNYAKAMEHQLAAIQAAQPLCTSKSAEVRRAAKEVLVDAHLAAAKAIALGHWQQKEKALPRWIAKAMQHCEDLIQHEGASQELWLRANSDAALTCAGLDGKLDAAPWIAAARKAGEPLITQSSDTWRRNRLHWELGQALTAAAEVAFDRAQFDEALVYSQAAIEHLEQGQANREPCTSDNFLVAQACFRLGALHSVHKSDHKVAVTWFEKADNLLDVSVDSPVPMLASERGEALVGMAVSYWQTGNRERAIELTERGAKLMSEAADAGQIARESLIVPYGNLASMHEASGNSQKAQEFARLADQSRADKVQQATFEQEQKRR